MLLYRVQVYIGILVIREKMNQVKISQEDKAEIVNGECHYISLSKQNMLVISVAPIRFTKKVYRFHSNFVHPAVSQPTLFTVLLQLQ